MVKIRNSHRRLRNESLKNRGELHFDKLNGIALYAAYQPQVTYLGTLIPDFRAAIINCKLGGIDRTEAKNKIQDDFMQVLNGLSGKIEADANLLPQSEAEAFIKGTGFELMEAKAPTPKKVITFLEVPTNFKVTDEKKQGAGLFDWDEKEGAITYLIEVLLQDDFWKVVGVSDTPSTVFSGFPSKGIRVFRIRALGEGNLMSDCSEPVTVWIS